MYNICSYCIKALLHEVLSEHAQHAVWPATLEALAAAQPRPGRQTQMRRDGEDFLPTLPYKIGDDLYSQKQLTHFLTPVHLPGSQG